MHRKMKEIDSITKYKEEHKAEYMSKILGQALQRYSLQEIEIGVPKFLVFYYQKPTSSPQKVFLSPQIIKCEGTINSISKNCQLSFVDSKKIIEQSVERKLINIKNDAGIQVEGSVAQGMYIFNQTVALVFKVLLSPSQEISEHLLSNSDEKKRQLMFQIKLKIESDVGQVLSQLVYKMQPIRPPSIDYELTFHNYEMEHEEIDIPLNIKNTFNGEYLNNESMVKLIASHTIEYHISEAKDQLTLKAQYKKINSKGQAEPRQIWQIEPLRYKPVDIVLLDAGDNFVLGMYRINLISYHKMEAIPVYEIGQICKFKFPFFAGEENQNTLSKNEQNSSKSDSKDFVGRVHFYSSHPNQCQVLCQGKQQILCERTKVYEIQIKYQSFIVEPIQDRIVVQAVSIDPHTKVKTAIKKWLLKIRKNLEDYKSIFQLQINQNSPITFKYQLKNKTSKQRSFKLFPSNFSILTVPESQIILNPNQETSVDLEIVVRKQDLSTEVKQRGIQVMMRVEERGVGSHGENEEINGWSELFRLKLKLN